MNENKITRRRAIGQITAAAAGAILPAGLLGCRETSEIVETPPEAAPAAELSAAALTDDELRLVDWVETKKPGGTERALALDEKKVASALEQVRLSIL